MYRKMRKKISLAMATLLAFSFISFGHGALKPVEAGTRPDVVKEEAIGFLDFEGDNLADENSPLKELVDENKIYDEEFSIEVVPDLCGDTMINEEVKITTVAAINVTTTERVEPVLPDEIEVQYDDKTTSKLAVVWDPTSEGQYFVLGTFEIEGVIEGTHLKAKAIITVVAKEKINLDVNEDGKINIADLAIISYYYQSKLGDENWEEAKIADVDGDDGIGSGDLSIVAKAILDKR